jgi:hypothetical protein
MAGVELGLQYELPAEWIPLNKGGIRLLPYSNLSGNLERPKRPDKNGPAVFRLPQNPRVVRTPMRYLWILVSLAVAALVWVVRTVVRTRRERRRAVIADAIADFHLQREHLEARFLELAAGRGQPAGWAWRDGEFEDDFVLACKRGSGSLRALVQATVFLEKAVHSPAEAGRGETKVQLATAVFVLNGDRWTTEGRTVLDLDPEETIERFSEELERIL